MSNAVASLEAFLAKVEQRDGNQPEFLQAVREVFTSIWPFLEKNPKYRSEALLERLVEPERIIQFRVAWTDDKGQVHVNRLSAFNSTALSVLSKVACVFTRPSTNPF